MSKAISTYERGTLTVKSLVAFGKVDPGATSAVNTIDAKNTGTETMTVECQLIQVAASVQVYDTTASIVHKRGMTTIASYTLAWDDMLGYSVQTPTPITDFQANDILQIDLTWAPDGGLVVSPTTLPGLLRITEV